MNNSEVVRCTADRFTNFERAYTVYFIRKGSFTEELSIYARSLYQAVAHSVSLISYAFNKLEVLEVVIIPAKASRSGLSVYRYRKGHTGIIKRLQEVTDSNISVFEILANWNNYKAVNHFVG